MYKPKRVNYWSMGVSPLKVSIEYHLRYNHYPPVDPVFVDIALDAIHAVIREDFDMKIELPNGILLKAKQIVQELHLDYYVTQAAQEVINDNPLFEIEEEK